MRMIDGELRLSASDLMRFQGCAHASALDLRQLEVGDLAPDEDTAEARLLQRQGDDHEAAYLEALRAEGRSIVEITKDDLTLEQAVAQTADALKAGPDIIFQGAFLGGRWGGYSDFLEKKDRPSGLGGWSYEVIDTKLKRSPDPKHVLQLSLYSDLLEQMQGLRPQAAHIQLGDGNRFSVRLDDVADYARHTRSTFEGFIGTRPSTRPTRVSSCKLCRWRSTCQAEWEDADSLTLVAGITTSQRLKLEAAGIVTMPALAARQERVPQLSPDIQIRLAIQARLQQARRAGGPPDFVLRAIEAGRGLSLVPEPDAGDVFYDIEGDPYYADGLEYLHGVWFFEDDTWRYRAFWAHDREQEGIAAGELLEFLVERLERFPGAHVYHYANYEIAALRRVTAFHRRGEAAMDQLQRQLRFVDLHRVVSGGLIASEPGYSIKDLEVFYMEKRDGDVATAGASVVMYETWRETGSDEALAQIRDYNETDCRSTQLLRDWLVTRVRPADLPWRPLGPVPDAGALARVEAEEAEVEALREKLAPVREDFSDEIADLVLDLNAFHEREDKPTWWAIFDRLSRESEDLIEDLDCLAGLVATGPAEKDKLSMARVYSYPPQETKLRAGKKPCAKPADGPTVVDLAEMTHDTVRLRSTLKNFVLPDRLDLIPPKPIGNKPLRAAIAAVTEGLIARTGEHPAIADLLRRSPPRFTDGLRPNGIIDPSAELVAETSAAIQAMDHSVLAIQGPPGTGKTYASAAAIVDLVRSGRRVAVSSNSHKAVANLLTAIAARARSKGVDCSIVQKVSDDGDAAEDPDVVAVKGNTPPEITAADVVGTTAWHFATYAEPAFDHLFIDEAGQVSLANLVAMARSARNLVLVGDPMQLPQPLQGLHPGSSGASCLEYLIGEHRVVPADKGIFLGVSRRMHPAICDFISQAVYEGRLTNDAGAGLQRLTARDGTTSLVGAHIEPVVHSGRSQASPEEVDAVVAAVGHLLGATFHDRDGAVRPIEGEDILVVAPYNAQVNALRTALPADIRVGTVDRFQGQEAPICLISMATSSAEELPRDIEFLFSLNRINVAISRAQVMAVMFASPALLDTPCRTVDQMALVNTLCRLAAYVPRRP